MKIKTIFKELSCSKYESCGVYIIKNINSGKSYVGSTITSFKKRLYHHFCCLKNNSHKNILLQRAWNKYGEDDFTYDILEQITDKQIIRERELYYINSLDCLNKKKGYNINKTTNSVDCNSKEFKQGRIKTKLIMQRRSTKYKQWKSGNLADKELSKNELSQFKNWLNSKNKDRIINEEIRKKQSLAAKNRRLSDNSKISKRKATRLSLPKIYVYSNDLNLLGVWNSGPDLQEESESNMFVLKQHMTLRNPNGRNKLSPYRLSSSNINKSCKTTKLYKELRFSYVPL